MARKRVVPTAMPKKTETQNSRAAAGWQDRISKALKEQKKSRRQLSIDAGLGHSTCTYLLTKAQTLSLDNAISIADALGMQLKELVSGEQVTLDAPDDLGRVVIKAIRIGDEDDFIAVHAAGLPKDLKALKMTDSSMEPRGLNEAGPSDAIVLQGDVVVYSPSTAPKPGSLVVISEKFAGSEQLTVRRLVRGEDGLVAVANDADYGRAKVSEKDVAGSVILLQRRV